MKIIAITGHRGSGKDTLARELHKYLINTYGHVIVVDKFAADLLNMSSSMLSFPMEDYDKIKDDVAYRKPTIRTEILYISDTMKSVVGDNVFLNLFRNRVSKLDGLCDILIISDLRLPTEVDYIKAMDGYIIRVSRDGYVSKGTHNTETHTDRIHADLQLTNIGINNKFNLPIDEICNAIGFSDNT